jgi:hypothetical protein
MPFTVEEFRDLVRIVEERPEWRAELRRLVLTDELLSLPAQVANSRAQTEQGFQQLAEAQRRTEERVSGLEEAVTQLAEAQRRTEEQVADLTRAVHTLTGEVGELKQGQQTLTTDVGGLKGMLLELRYRERAPAYLGRLVRRARVLSAEELEVLLEGAVARGALSEAEAEEVTWADLVVRGRRREDTAEVYLVLEISWGIGPHDVERAARRASLLAQTGTPALPIVAGKTVTAEAARLIQTMQVWQITDGQMVAPEHASESS